MSSQNKEKSVNCLAANENYSVKIVLDILRTSPINEIKNSIDRARNQPWYNLYTCVQWEIEELNKVEEFGKTKSELYSLDQHFWPKL